VAHDAFRIEHDRRELRAVCRCGWRSDRTRAAGIAGALWDLHVTAVHAEADRRAS
jgi:hypothetical protein